MKVIGYFVFWLKFKNFKYFLLFYLSVFVVDIFNFGWYGFFFLFKYGVIKIVKYFSGIFIYLENSDC